MGDLDGGYPTPARPPGAAQRGRHREHVVPGRPRRVAPSFTVEEYTMVAAAAARVGLTPTGFCALAALAVAANPSAASTVPAGGVALDGRSRRDDLVEALAALQAELAEARTAVNRIGVNLNQAARILNTSGAEPVWLARVVGLCGRALAAVDTAATRIHRRL